LLKTPDADISCGKGDILDRWRAPPDSLKNKNKIQKPKKKGKKKTNKELNNSNQKERQKLRAPKPKIRLDYELKFDTLRDL
jgi:hypothetical protein